MPKKTFFNLNSEKREKIEQAIEKEFGRTSFDKFSISKIIQEAKIPRGSFYQYFENKEDAIKYIMQKYIMTEKENMKKIWRENNGDIFKVFLNIFDYTVQNIEENCKTNLYKSIFQEIRKNNITLFEEEEDLEEIFKNENLICIENLNIDNEKDVKYIMKIMSIITRTEALNVSLKKISKQEAKNELEKQFNILKRGMLKNKKY